MTVMDKSARADALGPGEVEVPVLEGMLWTRLERGDSAAETMSAWLSLLAGEVERMQAGVVVLSGVSDAQYAPVATWPAEAKLPVHLMEAAQQALETRRSVTLAHSGEGGTATDIALPLILGDATRGVVAIRIGRRDPAAAGTAFRALRWGAAWVRHAITAGALEQARHDQQNAATALRLLAATLEEKNLRRAATAFLSHLAKRFDCDRVSLGFIRRGHARVYAISETARFSKQMNLVRMLGAAMDEALDQRGTVVLPADPDEPIATRAHEELSHAHGAAVILTVPLFDSEQFIGALVLERNLDEATFDDAERATVEYVAACVAPVLSDKRDNDRLAVQRLLYSTRDLMQKLFGPRHFAAKLGLVGLVAMAAFFSVMTTADTISAEARIDGTVRRAVVAPFDGFIREAPARPGDELRKGDVVVALDDRDLVLEQLSAITERRQQEQLHVQALGERKSADINIIRARIDKVDAQIQMIEERLARATILAPFDGIVVSGDLSQRIGGTVQKGEQLVELAPLDSYRIVLQVDESRLVEVSVGQTGTLIVAALPDEPFDFEIERITPIAETVEGRNVFEVEARLEGDADRLRPGMLGIGRIHVGERLLIAVWTRPFVDWGRLFLWRWMP